MADRETIVGGGSDSSLSGIAVFLVVVVLLVLGFLVFNGTINFSGPSPGNSITINVPEPAQGITVTQPQSK